MKECSPRIARNLDFYVNNPKWLDVQTECTVWTNTAQANWNKPGSQFPFADAGPGFGKLMGGLISK